MNVIQKSFLHLGIERAGLFLLKRNDAIKFIIESQKQNIRILGIDGFFITKDATQPSLEHSIDISGRNFNEEDYNQLIEFLLEKDQSMYFEIICKE